MQGSEDVTVTKLTQPDFPFIIWHLPVNNEKVIRIDYDPFHYLAARIISKEQSDEEIKDFDLAMNGGK